MFWEKYFTNKDTFHLCHKPITLPSPFFEKQPLGVKLVEIMYETSMSKCRLPICKRLLNTCLNKILKLFILLEFFKEANGFFVMATEFSIYFFHFICIFF